MDPWWIPIPGETERETSKKNSGSSTVRAKDADPVAGRRMQRLIELTQWQSVKGSNWVGGDGGVV